MPLPSPTTTSAVKLKRRPPLTTFDTRLIVTTRSRKALFSAESPRRLSRRSPPRRSRPPSEAPPAPPAEPVVLRCGPAISGSFALVRSAGSCSQGQAPLAGAVSDGGDTAVVLVAAAVEHDGLDTGLLGTLGDELADLAGLGGLVGVAHRTQLGLGGRGEGERVTDRVVDDLHGDVAGRTRDDQARARRGAVDLLAHPEVAAAAGNRTALAEDLDSHGLLTSLSGLALDDLARVAHTLALVGLGLADLADVGRDLADLLLVDARDRELGRGLDGKGDACRGGDDDGVAEAERELEVRALRDD